MGLSGRRARALGLAFSVVPRAGRDNAAVTDLDDGSVQAWRAAARDAAWQDQGRKNATCARLSKLAMEVGS
jgi:hypothetical protein